MADVTVNIHPEHGFTSVIAWAFTLDLGVMVIWIYKHKVGVPFNYVFVHGLLGTLTFMISAYSNIYIVWSRTLKNGFGNLPLDFHSIGGFVAVAISVFSFISGIFLYVKVMG